MRAQDRSWSEGTCSKVVPPLLPLLSELSCCERSAAITSSSVLIDWPCSSNRKQCGARSRASAGEPLSKFCTKTSPARCATVGPHRSRMHLGVLRSTSPAQMRSRESSSELKSAGAMHTSSSSPSRNTLTITWQADCWPANVAAMPWLAGRFFTPCCTPCCAGFAALNCASRAVSISSALEMVRPAMLRSTSPGWRDPSEAPLGKIRCTRIARAT
mmetsp:Transcript_71352/g.137790  ORF Transcript_71352/g.137790 Transcript_71352/m.137790 type:complete len:215 (-) Transcript_71352:140-784(-)